MKTAVKIRVGALLVIFAAAATFGVDYALSLRWRSLLDSQPKEFELTLEADMCGALTGQAYYGPRYFLRRTLKEYGVSYRIVAGRCQRAQRATIAISRK
jgi:hypothetical protein